MAVTLIQMINRVRRRHRFPDVTTLTADDLVSPVQDALNESARQVLESRSWDFLIRHDGMLTTRPRVQASGVVILKLGGLDQISDTVPSTTATDHAGDFVTRARITSDASFGDTSFRVPSVRNFGGQSVYFLDTAWPGSSDLAASLELFAAEYLLPDTVGDVLSVRHQEQDLELCFVPRQHGFDSVVQRYHESFSDSPRVVYVGAQITSTYDRDQASSGDTGLGMLLYPTPESELALHYSYRYRHADMTETTDTLVGVPNHVVDQIIELAVAKTYISHIGNDINLGAKIRDDAMENLDRLYAMHRPDPARRVSFGSHFGGGGRLRYGGRPKNPQVFHTE